MNFSPLVKAWIQLVSLIVGTGGAVTVAAKQGGANWSMALLCGGVTAATNVYHALSDSPRDKASKTNAPFPSNSSTQPTTQ